MVSGTKDFYVVNVKSGKIIKEINNMPAIEKGIIKITKKNKLILAGVRKLYLIDYYKNSNNFILIFIINNILNLLKNNC